jgi:hypothetical protein
MRNYYFILTILFVACNSQISDGDTEKNAIKITQLLDNKSITTFNEWNYFTRGGDNWQKINGDSVLYTCVYVTSADTTTIMVFRPERFILDFPCSFTFDTLNYWRFSLKKAKDNLISVVGVNKNGRDITLATNQKLSTLFTKANPYDKLNSLNELKNKLGVIGVHSYNNRRIGNFIQFYLSRQHILTYFPDSIHIDNEYWKKEFATGKMLNKNWNYRKLENPIDNG